VAKLELKTPTKTLRRCTGKFERGHPHGCKLVVWTEMEAEEEEEKSAPWTGGALEQNDV